MKTETISSVFYHGTAMLGIAAVAFIFCGAPQYYQQRHEARRTASETAVLDKPAEAARVRRVLRQIDTGNVQDAKQELSFQLAADLRELRAAVLQEEGPLRETGLVNLKRMTLDEMAHPDCYLSKAPGARRAQQQAWAEIAMSAGDLASSAIK